MPKEKRTKVRLNRTDIWRTVLTDTAPFEVPIIVSNDGFYKNLRQLNSKSCILRKFVQSLLFHEKQYTIPYRYNIVKDGDSIRTLSLVHPQGQIQLAKFYQKYDQLICEYAGRSPFSIRKPTKIGTSFFNMSTLSDHNRYKAASVDTEGIDQLVRNPASYFSYSGFNRLYQFFISNDHVKLEKKYRFLLCLDITKCFDSIYTHSIAWAVKSKELAKENTRSLSFGNRFDQVMQKLNYNETSGICIGPEASRIFSEIILAVIDQNVEKRLVDQSYIKNTSYECRRYVDNYYIFANSRETLKAIKLELSVALREYNLHLSDTKIELLERPFYTNKSLAIDRVGISINRLWRKTILTKRSDQDLIKRSDEEKYEVPKEISNYRSEFGSFVREVKMACFASNLGYDAVSNYLIGAIRRKVVNLADSFQATSKSVDDCSLLRRYRELFLFLLDIGFYFFTLHPTVASSLRLSHAIVRVGQHLSRHDKEGFSIAKEATLRWTSQLSRSPAFASPHRKEDPISIELLNILLSLREYSGDASLEAEFLNSYQLRDGGGSYFHLVVRLFIFGGQEDYKYVVDAVFEQAYTKILASKNFYRNAELVYLLLDILACPHIDVAKRGELIRAVWPVLKQHDNRIGNISKSRSEQLACEIEMQHWFVRWDNIHLLNMIEKKELSSVYA